MSGTVTLENKWPVLGLSGVPSEDGCQACPGVGLVAVTRGARRCGRSPCRWACWALGWRYAPLPRRSARCGR